MSDAALPLEFIAERLILLVAVAVFFGLAFEETYKRDDPGMPGGIRTFPMLALAGAMLFLTEPHYALAFIAGLIAVALWLLVFLRNGAVGGALPKPTLMVPAASLFIYAVAPIALTQSPWVAVGVTVPAVLLLGAREQIHGLARLVPHEEVLTTGKFLVLAAVILPLVPDTRLTDLTALTPYRVWLAVVVICGLSYASYLVQRYRPAQHGTLLAALVGGLYSSSATTVVLAKRLKELAAPRGEIAAGIVLATAIMYLRLGVVIGLFDLHLATTLAPAIIALFAVGLLGALWERRAKSGADTDPQAASFTINPLQLTTALVFATLLIATSIATTWVSLHFGRAGLLILAAAVGAADIDPFVLNIAQGGIAQADEASLAAAVLVAASSNNLVKAGYAVAFGGATRAGRPAAMLVILAVLGILAALLEGLWLR